MVKHGELHLNKSIIKQTLTLHVIITKLNSYDAIHGFLRNRGLISSQTLNEDVKRIGKCVLNRLSLFQCAALVGEDQPLCPDLPELDLSELDVSDLDADSFLGGLKWYSDQSEIISSQYGNEASNLFEVKRVMQCFLI